MTTLVPVDHDPFALQKAGTVAFGSAPPAGQANLTPVDHDPFAGQAPASRFDAAAPATPGDPTLIAALEAKRLDRTAPGTVASAGLGAVDMASFGFSDEIAGLVSAAVKKIGGDPGEFWKNYEETAASVRGTMKDAQDAHPIAFGGGQVAGGAASLLVPGGAVARTAGMGGKMLAGAKVGAATGAAYGAGSADGGVGERAAGAATGAGIGFATGAAAAPIAAGAGKIVNSVVSKVGDRFAAKALDVPTEAVTKVRSAVADDVATKSIRAPSDGDMVMNLGPTLASRAEAVATQPGRGSNILLDAGKKQADEEGGRIKAVVDRTLGKDQGRVLDAKAVEAERKAAGKLYETARASATPVYIGDIRNTLDDVIAESDGSIRAGLERLRSLRAFADPKGGTQLHRSAADLHAARIEIDDAIRAAGLGTNQARLLGKVRDQVDATLKKSAPGYKQADLEYSAVMKGKEALQEGRNVFTRAYGSPDELKAELDAMAPEVRNRFVKGARDAISVLMGTSRNDAAAVRRELLEKGWNAEKLQILVGKDTAAVIERALEASANRASGRNMLVGNSRTAMRLSAQKAFPGEVSAASVGQGLRSSSLTGVGLNTLVAVAEKASGGLVTKAINRSRANVAEGAAKLLSAKDATRDQVLKVLAEAEQKAGRALNAKEQMEAVTRAFTIPVGTATGVRAVEGDRTGSRPQ